MAHYYYRLVTVTLRLQTTGPDRSQTEISERMSITEGNGNDRHGLHQK